jgi:hypothetical protein
MAPSKVNNMGIFRLTTPPGLDNIRNCRRTGFPPQHPSILSLAAHLKPFSSRFHPHDADPRGPLFASCAHARVDAALSVELVDQR